MLSVTSHEQHTLPCTPTVPFAAQTLPAWSVRPKLSRTRFDFVRELYLSANKMTVVPEDILAMSHLTCALCR